MEHTPWIVFATPEDPDFAYEVNSSKGEIATVYKHSDAEAHALLIASAPDLLAERDALKAQRDELVAGLQLAYIAMQHMGNVLNNIDAVDEEEDAKHDAAFEAVAALISKHKGASHG